MSDLTLERIRSIGGIVTAKTEPREITWTGTDPHTGERTEYTHTVEVRRMAFGWIDRVTREVRATAKNGHDERQSVGATMIAGGVLFGGESMAYADALQLDASLANELLRAFYAVNGMRPTVEPVESEQEQPAKN